MRVTEPKRITTYYEALVEKRADHIGIFYACVKTTSIFCIATCRARKPKKENVEFFTTFKEALDNGYRPCKICRPTEHSTKSPAFVETAIDLVRKHPKQKVTDYQLKTQGISPEGLRRWFKSQYGITFQAFQRMYRINNAYTELKQGDLAIHAAYGNGYESLSGFGYTYKKLIGSSPKEKEQPSPILINRTETPLGPMFIASSSKGICLLEFVDRRMLETELKDLQRLLKTKIIAGENEHIVQVRKELDEYFHGDRRTFDVALDSPGTTFQQQVWKELLTISFGDTRSYQDQANRIGNPKAVRAVASANGHNRIAILIPCHRVIGKDGSLTGYGGGLERKKWLLAHERESNQQVVRK